MPDVLSPNPLTSKPTDVLVKDAKPKVESTELQGLTPAQKGVLQAEEEQEAFKQFGEQTKREQDSMLSAGKVQAIQKFAEEREPAELNEQLDTYVKEQAKPFIPTEKTAGDLGLIFTLTTILGFAIGGGAKGSAQAALSAQNGMLEGYQKGDMDAYKKQKDIFEQNQKALAKAVEGLKYELAQAEKTASVDKDLAMAQAEKAAVTYGGDAFKEYVKKNGIPKSAEHAKSLESMSFKNLELQERLTRDANELTMQKARLGLEKARLDEDIRHHKQEELKKARGTFGATAFLNEVLGGSTGNAKSDQDIVNTGLGVSQLGHVINLFKDPEVQTGVVGKLTSIRSKISSAFDNNHEITEDEFKRIVDGEISPTAKNAVAQKEALFAAYTAEREIAGGRLLVSVVKQAGGALDPTNYEKEGYLNLLNSRQGELIKRLHGQKMNDQQIKSLVSGLEEEARPTATLGATAAPAATAPTSKPADVPSSAKYSPSQHKWWWQENGEWKSKDAQ